MNTVSAGARREFCGGLVVMGAHNMRASDATEPRMLNH